MYQNFLKIQSKNKDFDNKELLENILLQLYNYKNMIINRNFLAPINVWEWIDSKFQEVLKKLNEMIEFIERNN